MRRPRLTLVPPPGGGKPDKLGATKPKFLGDTLRRARSKLALSIPDLAAQLGIDRNTLGGYEREERAPPDVDFLGHFAEVTGADLGELLEARLAASKYAEKYRALLRRPAGAAEPEPPPYALAGATPAPLSKPTVAPWSADYVYLPLYNLRAAAGERGVLVEGEHATSQLAFREEFIRNELRVAPSDLLLLHVEGDSGEPDLRAGDIIMVNRADTTARREGFYVIRMDDALLVKQVQRMPGGVLKLISRNPAYEPILLPVPSVQPGGPHAIIGRVVWACRRF